MMETLFELRSDSGYCRLFDFFSDASTAMDELIANRKFRPEELYIARVVTE